MGRVRSDSGSGQGGAVGRGLAERAAGGGGKAPFPSLLCAGAVGGWGMALLQCCRCCALLLCRALVAM